MSTFIELMTCDRRHFTTRKIIFKLAAFIFEFKLLPKPYHAYCQYTVSLAHSGCKCTQAPRTLLLFQ